jgi:hypothetical protein
MSNFQSWKINNSITSIIEGSKKFKWLYPEVHEKALLLMITTIKGAPRVSLTRLNNLDRIITNYHIFFKYLGLNFVHYADKSRLTNKKIELSDLALPHMENIFVFARDTLMNGIKASLSESHYVTYQSVLKNVGSDAKLYCFMFLSLANDKNIINDLTEEYYLIKEIDAFKNIKE